MLYKIFNSSGFTLFMVIIVAIGFLVPVDNDEPENSAQYSGTSSMTTTPHYIKMLEESAARRAAMQAALDEVHAAHGAFWSDSVKIHKMTLPSALTHPHLTEKQREMLTTRGFGMPIDPGLNVDPMTEGEPGTGKMKEATSLPEPIVPKADDPEADVPETDAPEI